MTMDGMKPEDNKGAIETHKAAFQILSASQELFVLMSPCTRLPFVQCDPETFDDQICVYESEEDLKREGQRFLQQRQPVHPAK